MKQKNYLSIFLMLIVCSGQRLAAQNIFNDTIWVNTTAEVTLRFPSDPKATLPAGEGFYQVARGGGKNSLSAKAVKENAKPEPLLIDEGDRHHRFVIMMTDGTPRLMYDWSKKKDLKKYTDDKKAMVKATFEEAEQRFAAGACDDAMPKYRWLVHQLDDERLQTIQAHLNQCETANQARIDKEYKDAMASGNSFTSQKDFAAADAAFTKALTAKPGDSLASIKQKINRSSWMPQLASKAGTAADEKRYTVARLYYEKIREVDPKWFATFCLAAYNNTVKKETEQRYEKHKASAVSNRRLKEFDAALADCDSALHVKPKDPFIVKLQSEIVGLRSEGDSMKVKYVKYYQLLIEAKSLAAKATSAKDYDLAIEVYDQAADLLPSRRFPLDQIKALKKKKTGAGF